MFFSAKRTKPDIAQILDESPHYFSFCASAGCGTGFWHLFAIYKIWPFFVKNRFERKINELEQVLNATFVFSQSIHENVNEKKKKKWILSIVTTTRFWSKIKKKQKVRKSKKSDYQKKRCTNIFFHSTTRVTFACFWRKVQKRVKTSKNWVISGFWNCS